MIRITSGASGIAAETLDQRQAVDAGHVDVGDDDVGPFSLDFGQRATAIGGFVEFIALIGQGAPDSVPRGVFVVDEEDFRWEWQTATRFASQTLVFPSLAQQLHGNSGAKSGSERVAWSLCGRSRFEYHSIRGRMAYRSDTEGSEPNSRWFRPNVLVYPARGTELWRRTRRGALHAAR